MLTNKLNHFFFITDMNNQRRINPLLSIRMEIIFRIEITCSYINVFFHIEQNEGFNLDICINILLKKY